MNINNFWTSTSDFGTYCMHTKAFNKRTCLYVNPFLRDYSCQASPTMNNYIKTRLRKTLPVIVRVTSVGTDISHMHKQTEQTLIRQLCNLTELPDLGLLCLQNR